MNTLVNIDDDTAEILFESIVSTECENFEGHILDDEYQNDGLSDECDVQRCNKLLDFNKKIISSLLDLKRRITFVLEKCERKLATIERGLQSPVGGEAKILVCNAGIPYFKDRHYFCPTNNEDDILKENRKELQLRNLPKVSPWTRKERGTLLKAIKEEAIDDILSSQKIDRAGSKLDEKRIEEPFSHTDFLDIIGPLHEREFDWFKISSKHFADVHSPLDCRVMWNVFLHPAINKDYWTKSEDTKLKEIAKKNEFENWEKIAQELNTNRTAYQCFIRYNTTKILPRLRNCNWKNEEDEQLLKLIEAFRIGDFIPWGEIASWMKNRTKQQVYFRWTYSLAPYLTKGRFTKAEDDILKDAVTKYGTNFRKISAALMPNRTTIQLHDRYQTLMLNHIWTLSDDAKLLNLFNCLGRNWSTIAKEFSCKTRIQLRHRYAALQKYLKRGFSLIDIHKNVSGSGGKNKEQRQTGKASWNSAKSSSNVTGKGDSSDIDAKLIEYFRMKHKLVATEHGQNCSRTVEISMRSITSLYNILKKFHAVLHIPNDISDVNLTSSDMQLLYLLQEYIRKKNDKDSYLEFIDDCRIRMFNENATKGECSHFVPPPPFQSQVKLRKSKKYTCIDYSLNTKNKFLVEQPRDFDTPDLVISHIGGTDGELQFRKLAYLLQLHVQQTQQPWPLYINERNNRSGTESKGQNFESKSSNSCNLPNVQSVCAAETNRKCNVLFAKREETHTTFGFGTEISPEHDTHISGASHATLLCLKNLIRLKKSNEPCNNTPYQSSIRSANFQEALNLLEMRFEQLFKYPIGLANVLLPEVHATDTFSYDDVTNKRKTPNAPENVEKHVPKKLRRVRHNRRNAR